MASCDFHKQPSCRQKNFTSVSSSPSWPGQRRHEQTWPTANVTKKPRCFGAGEIQQPPEPLLAHPGEAELIKEISIRQKFEQCVRPLAAFEAAQIASRLPGRQSGGCARTHHRARDRQGNQTLRIAKSCKKKNLWAECGPRMRG